MPVLSGRAGSGARSVLRALSGGLFAALALVAGGCGNKTLTFGTAVISVSTTPGPFTAYVAQISQIQLTRDDNQPAYPLLTPEVVDFTKLNDMTELFGAPAVIEGNYVSATITVNYAGAQIYTNVNGTSQAVTVLDATTGTTAGTITYTVKFDPAHPLRIVRGVSTPLNFNFDLSASSSLNKTTSPMQLSVRPFMTASTVPVYTRLIRARGVSVAADTGNNNFTMNARAFFDVRSNPVGAIGVQTDANTTYNVNGTSYTGAPGLAAVAKLPINTIIEAYGTLGTLNAAKPNFVATQVYAGIAVENLLADRVTGTVSSRSGNTLHIHGAEVEARDFSGATASGTIVQFLDDLPLTVGSATVVSVDGQPGPTNTSIQSISVGQQVDVEGLVQTNTAGTTVVSVDATQGLIRLVPTTAWGTLNAAAQASNATINLLTLGGYPPGALAFTGTGSLTGADANPTAYAVNTGTIDLSQAAANSLVRFDGYVTPFGGAPPDFIATTATPASASDQVLVVQWASGGIVAPFPSATLSGGLTVDTADAITATVQTGPVYAQSAANTIDLKNPLVTPKIIPDPSLTNQLTIGSPTSTAGLTGYNDFSAYLSQVTTVLNGSTKLQTLVAVGKWDAASGTFTAYRIDMLKLP